jgi:hypothetical protein
MISQKFDANIVFKRLGRRRPNFKYMCEHVEKSEHLNCIVETGTAWAEDNWEYQGQSTLIWDWLIRELPRKEAVSIDIRSEPHIYAKSKAPDTKVTFVIGDSVKALSSEVPSIILSQTVLLYLDSFDWSEEMQFQSSLHHLMELTSCWAKLPSGCLIVVDDRHASDKGKHVLVEIFMKQQGIEPVFKNCQVGWIKP